MRGIEGPRDDLLFFETSRIAAEHDRIVAADTTFKADLKTINAGLELLAQLLKGPDPSCEDGRVLRLIGLRLFNSAGASLTLGRQGFFVQAFGVVRDVLELAFLLDLFGRWPTEIERWRTLKGTEHTNAFRPDKIRKRLDNADGFTEKKRDHAYKQLSNFAAHPSIDSITLLQSNGLNPLGPCPDQRALKALLEELLVRFVPTVDGFSRHPWPQSECTAQAKRLFEREVASWLARRSEQTSAAGPGLANSGFGSTGRG